MSTPPSVRFRRRLLLGMPALVAAAAALVLRPTKATAKPRVVECAADLIGAP
ncbi:hypothetical protein [Rhizocola hellebori]|uniref:hypothetical protein n=1 Tax=Rhizocola hellebori TaxID=1392758 RepID=UPI001941E17A|nr:hypothetical protein [Rhizocola hellebori]